jgi:hypothetical protein
MDENTAVELLESLGVDLGDAEALDRGENAEVMRLARRVGLNVEDPKVAEILKRPFVNQYDAADLVDRERSALYAALQNGTLRAVFIQDTRQRNWRLRPYALLKWANRRPFDVRLVDAERAYAYVILEDAHDQEAEDIREAFREALQGMQRSRKREVKKPRK